MSIFTPPAGVSPLKLGFYAALGFVLSAVMLVPTLDPNAGIPDVSTLAEARGRVISVSPQKYGVKFRLDGRAETFDYPSKARGYDEVKHALRAASDKEVAVLFNPAPRTPWFSSDAYYDVWQLSINGESVRTIEESREGWRSDNALGPWLSASLLILALYLSLLARRALVERRMWR